MLKIRFSLLYSRQTDKLSHKILKRPLFYFWSKRLKYEQKFGKTERPHGDLN